MVLAFLMPGVWIFGFLTPVNPYFIFFFYYAFRLLLTGKMSIKKIDRVCSD